MSSHTAIVESQPESEAVTMWRAMVRDDLRVWAEFYGKILVNAKEEIIHFNVLQERFYEAFQWCLDNKVKGRFMIVKPRQRGCSTICNAALYWKSRRQLTTSCIIGGEYADVENLFSIATRYQEKDVFDWDNSGGINATRGLWSNESWLKRETAKDKNAGRSGTLQFLLCTEAARWDTDGKANAADVLNGILSCVNDDDPESCVILESTANGPVGPFYEMWKEAVTFEEFKAGERGNEYIKIFAGFHEFPECRVELTDKERAAILATTDKDEIEMLQLPGLTPENIMWRRKIIKSKCQGSSRKCKMDYPATPEQAFSGSHNGRFNQVQLSWQVAKEPTKGALDESKEGNITFRPSSEAAEVTTHIWHYPTEGESYILSSDPAEGAVQAGGKDTDCNSVVVLKKGRFREGGWSPPTVVARLAPPNRWDTGILNHAVWKLSTFYGRCMVVEELAKDRGLIEFLKEKGDIPIYRREVWNEVESRMTPAFGFATNERTRKMLIDNLATALRTSNPKQEDEFSGNGVVVNCAHILKELGTFITKTNGRDEAAPGTHDDDVLSLGIGLLVIDQATPYYKAERNNYARARRMNEGDAGDRRYF